MYRNSDVDHGGRPYQTEAEAGRQSTMIGNVVQGRLDEKRLRNRKSDQGKARQLDHDELTPERLGEGYGQPPFVARLRVYPCRMQRLE